MTDSVFDVALEKRFTDSGEIALLDVTSADMLLIRNNETGVVMRIAFSTLASATMAALSGSDVISKLGSTDAVPEGATNLYFTNARASAAAPVQSVAGRTGTVTLSKSDVGLSNVDNTADSTKSVNYATSAGSAPASDVYSWAKASTKPSYSKTEVGLSNVENTALSTWGGSSNITTIGVSTIGAATTPGDVSLDTNLAFKSVTGGVFDLNKLLNASTFKKNSATYIDLTLTRQSGLLVVGVTDVNVANNTAGGVFFIKASDGSTSPYIVSLASNGWVSLTASVISNTVIRIQLGSGANGHFAGSFIGTTIA